MKMTLEAKEKRATKGGETIVKKFIQEYGPLPNFATYVDELKFWVKYLPDFMYQICMFRRYLYDFVIEFTPLLNDPFYKFSTRVNWTINRKTDFPVCENPKCPNGKIIRKNLSVSDQWPRTCCRRCQANSPTTRQKTRQTNMKIYHAITPAKSDAVKRKIQQTKLDYSQERKEEINNKIKKTKEERYGDPNFSNREKYEKTMLEKYNTTSALRIPNVKQKIVENSMKKNGIPDPRKTKEANQKRLKTRAKQKYQRLLENEHVKILTPFEEFDLRDSQREYLWKCLDCGNVFTGRIDKNWYSHSPARVFARCEECFPRMTKKSLEEKDFLDEISKFFTQKVQRNQRVLFGKVLEAKKNLAFEVDGYVHELKLAFEYNGVYFHSEECPREDYLGIRNYHLAKQLLAEREGIRLMQIRSDQWLNNRDKTLLMIKEVIENPMNILKYSEKVGDQTYIVDRSLFNKCWKISGYEFHEELPPKVLEILDPNRKGRKVKTYHYIDSGYLILKKSKQPHDEQEK